MAEVDPQSVREILPQPKRSLLGQLDVYPRGVAFATQDRGERVYILLRRHIVTNLGWILRSIGLSALPVLIVLGAQILADTFPQFLPRNFSVWDLLSPESWVVAALLYYSTILSFAFTRFLDWYFDIYLVTSHRFLHLEFRILKGKFISEAPLKNIEDVRQSVVGVFPSLFDYGDVVVTTASEQGKFLFEAVPDPTWFRDVISDLNKLINRRGTVDP